MTFKVISVGWSCASFIERTLESIERQTVQDFEVCIIDDATEDPEQARIIREWCDTRDNGRWRYQINTERRNQVRNQHDALLVLAPADDDIVVWLDLDGDQLAHERVFEVLTEAYADGTLLTYGSYKPVPDPGTTTPATPFPEAVVKTNTYRTEALRHGCHFNHLRTMSGLIARHIPVAQFKWKDGRWYDHGADYIFMLAGLELAGGRYKCLPDVLMHYNHANPLADYLSHPAETSKCVMDFLKRPALAPLEIVDFRDDLHQIVESSDPIRETWDASNVATTTAGGSYRPVGCTDIYLPAEVRRQILHDVGAAWGLNVFIETGTNDGGTPMFLKDDFAQLHTIELGQRAYRLAVQLFRPYPQVQCWQGDSALLLPKILKKISEPALVWLDAHWSGGSTARGAIDTPVSDELTTLLTDGRPHVILVDDARLFGGGPEHTDEFIDYPDIEWVRQLAEEHGYDFRLEDDIMFLTPGEQRAAR